MQKLLYILKNPLYYLKRFLRKVDHNLTITLLSLLTKFHKSSKSPEIKDRTLCFITENIGDTIRASGIINYLNNHYEAHFVCTEYNKEVIRLLKIKDNHIISLQRDPGIKDFMKIFRDSLFKKYNSSIILDYTKSAKFGLYTSKMIGIINIIYKNFSDKELNYIETISKTANLDVLAVAKYLIVKDFIKLDLKNFKKQLFPDCDARYNQYEDFIGFHVGGFGSIMYPVSRKYPENYTFQLIEKLLQKGYKVLITGDIFDQQQFAEFSAKLKKHQNFVDLTGKLSLSELACLLSRLKIYITPDNGTLHLAQAVNCRKIIALLGPTSPSLVRGENTFIVRVDIPCSPCLKFLNFPPKCINSISHQCLKDLTPDFIFQKIKNFIE